ncbi:FtsK/SpoIIIE domain-containing protein [Sphingomonas koreensis]
MVDRIYLNSDDRETMAEILRAGLAERTDQWLPARIALAQSLQLPEPPDAERYKILSPQKGGVEIHAPQLIGEGKGPPGDLTDVYRALLSVYHNRNVAADDEEFHDFLQRHVRRGLDHIRKAWDRDRDFVDYLIRDLYAESGDLLASAQQGSAETQERVARILGQLGIGASVNDVHDGPRLTRYTLALHALDDLDRLRRNLTKIAFALGLDENAVTYSRAPGDQEVYLLVPRPPASWRYVGWSDVRDALKSSEAGQMALPMCLGTDAMGEPLLRDLAEAPHLFVAGTTGAGKSMCLHAILLSMMEAPGSNTELLLIDPKANEFSAYQSFKRLRTGSILTTADAALVAFEDLIVEMDDRQDRMRKLDARDIVEANNLGARMTRIVVVVDELADLIFTRRDIEAPLIRLAQKARSSGIHLVLATQRPEAATFSGLLRSNIPSRIALTVQKAAESRIILDESGAEALQKRGDMLVRFAGEPTIRAHGCRVDPTDIQAALEGA